MRFLIFIFAVFVLLGCYRPAEHPKPFFFQDSVYQAFSEDTILLTAQPFAIVFGLEGWEIQAADTGMSLSYVITDDLSKTNSFFEAQTEKELQENFSSYKVPTQIKDELITSKNMGTQIMRHVLKRYKGKQECYFSRCKESPALLRLILDVKSIDGIPTKKLKSKKYLYFFAFRSNNKTYNYKGFFKIN